jgi:hypothetical protein
MSALPDLSRIATPGRLFGQSGNQQAVVLLLRTTRVTESVDKLFSAIFPPYQTPECFDRPI